MARWCGRYDWAVAALLALALSLAACRGPARTPGLAFADCPPELTAQLAEFAPERAAAITLGCAGLSVPLDHTRPDAEQLTLQVIRARSGPSPRLGVLVFHPGGPGDPGTTYFPYLLSWLPEPILASFDVVSLDPRGTGGSAPINCPAPPTREGPQPVPLSDAAFAAAAARERALAERCAGVLGGRAAFFTTEAAAADLDRLREALGEERVSLLGLSYGAKVGAEYAHRFPDRVRAAVLDAPSRPGSTVMESIQQQTAGFEDTFGVYAAGCRTRPTCRLGDPGRFVSQLAARADREPIASRRLKDHRPADGRDVLDAVKAGLYDEARWADLDESLWEASTGDNAGGVFAMGEAGTGPEAADSDPADSRDANYVVNCNDSAPGPSDAELGRIGRQLARDHPVFGARAAADLVACRSWSAERSPLELPAAPTRDPLLVVGTVHDPATPYDGAVALTAALGNARLITWEGHNHTALSYSRCVADAATRYLVESVLPPAGTRCPA